VTLLRKIWPDHLPLTKALPRYLVGSLAIIVAFWCAWFPVFMLLVLIDLVVTGDRGGATPDHAIHLLWRGALYLLIYGCAFWASIGVWRSVATVLGKTRTPAVARAGATIFALVAMLIILSAGELASIASWRYGLDISDTYDSKRTSDNASLSLKPTSKFPFTGFWKQDCDLEVGVAIEKESRWLNSYHFENCGTSGCGFWKVSSIVNDPQYRVIDQNTIEFEDMAKPTLYHRCH
jgi:hypothetical protein